MTSRALFFIGMALILSGCGGGEGGGGGGSAGAPPNSKVELKGAINQKFNSLGDLKYLGELINTGQVPVCFVKIVIDSKNAAGGLIDSDFTFVEGSTLSISSIETDTCLKPGEFGAFEVSTSLKFSPASFSTTINWETDNVTTPVVTSSQVILDGTITESTDFFGDLTLRGFIKNTHTTKTVRFVEITFVAIKNGLVQETDFTFVNGSTCDSTDTCLAPGASGSFEVGFNIPPDEVESYYYKINYSVVD